MFGCIIGLCYWARVAMNAMNMAVLFCFVLFHPLEVVQVATQSFMIPVAAGILFILTKSIMPTP